MASRVGVQSGFLQKLVWKLIANTIQKIDLSLKAVAVILLCESASLDPVQTAS